MIPLFESVDLASPAAVVQAFTRGADANRDAPCRRGSIDVIHGPGRLIATGDLHDNPMALARLASLAGMTAAGGNPAAHLTLHEVVHSDRLSDGMDFSYRALARVALLKQTFPEHVHTLLANHELSQIMGAGIIKDGINVVGAFNEGVEYVFGEEAAQVQSAIGEFIKSMPLALLCESGPASAASEPRDVLCAHSLPGPLAMERFDAGVLERDLRDEDYLPRTGSAHAMVWGRGQRPVDLERLAARWRVGLFVLGHEKAESGVLMVPPNAVVLNSDHERGKYLDIDLARPPAAKDVKGAARPLMEIA